ncbi:hypothetical protein CYY_000875 [Polysphondylium violaceum]|uniref:WD40 repeat-containing protein n=1 Tax=Polysphondylium violaceum TaxID=133409 RepID=A0A8J4Q331_9MYCE|nr:hypothetical protein CYY_000875 [Polysphondylium violaceum]
MDVLVGCETGVTKVYNLHSKQPVGLFGAIDNSLELNHMKFGWECENKEDFVLQSFNTGLVRYWNAREKNLLSELNYDQSIHAIHPLNNKRLLVALPNGNIDIKAFDQSVNTLDLITPPPPPKKKVAKGKSATTATTEQPTTTGNPNHIQFKVINYNPAIKSNLLSLDVNPLNTKIAWGGKEANAQIWDLETKTKTWIAKYSHDFLNLQEPTLINDIRFIGEDKIIVGNDIKLKAFDLKDKARKPFLNVSFSKHQIQNISYNPQRDYYVVASDTVGNVFSYDLRNGKQLGSYKDSTGGIRDMSIHPTLPLLATVGLDRMLRVYDIDSRKMLHKIYLKQRLSGVLFSKDLPPTQDQEDEELWNTMDQNNIKQENQDSDDEQAGKKVSVKVTSNMDSDDEVDEEDDDSEQEEQDDEFNLGDSSSEEEVDSDDNDSDSDDDNNKKGGKNNKRKQPIQKQSNKKQSKNKLSQAMIKKFSNKKAKK